MKKIITTLLVVFALTAQAEWTFVGDNPEGDRYFLDLSTIKKSANGHRAWEMADEARGRNGTLSIRRLTEYDCRNERSRVLQQSQHSGHMGSGEVVHSSSSPASWRYVSPGSVGEWFFDAVCHQKMPSRSPPPDTGKYFQKCITCSRPK